VKHGAKIPRLRDFSKMRWPREHYILVIFPIQPKFS
jgi:hypothetical protein